MVSLALDIETIPDLGGTDFRDISYLKQRQRKDSEEDLIGDFSLNPYTLFVVSVAGVKIEDEDLREGFVIYITNTSSDQRKEDLFYTETEKLTVYFYPVRRNLVESALFDLERELLERFWSLISDVDRVITFNGDTFDNFVLRTRTMIHALEVDKDTFSKLYSKKNLDLMKILSDNRLQHSYKFEFICRKFGIHLYKDSFGGKNVKDAFMNGEYEQIARYNIKDALALAQLFLRIKNYIDLDSSSQSAGLDSITEKQKNKIIGLLKDLTDLQWDDIQPIVDAQGNNIHKTSATAFISILEEIAKISKEREK